MSGVGKPRDQEEVNSSTTCVDLWLKAAQGDGRGSTCLQRLMSQRQLRHYWGWRDWGSPDLTEDNLNVRIKSLERVLKIKIMFNHGEVKKGNTFFFFKKR